MVKEVQEGQRGCSREAGAATMGNEDRQVGRLCRTMLIVVKTTFYSRNPLEGNLLFQNIELR